MLFQDFIKDRCTCDLIDLFQSHARVSYQSRQVKADKILALLKTKLTSMEYVSLSIARNHFVLGEGVGELDDVCIRLKLFYVTNN